MVNENIRDNHGECAASAIKILKTIEKLISGVLV